MVTMTVAMVQMNKTAVSLCPVHSLFIHLPHCFYFIKYFIHYLANIYVLMYYDKIINEFAGTDRFHYHNMPS